MSGSKEADWPRYGGCQAIGAFRQVAAADCEICAAPVGARCRREHLLASLGGRRFGAILADPPWAFEGYAGQVSTPHRRRAGDHYPVVSLEGLKALAWVVDALAAPDCLLMMWAAPDCFLPQALELGAAWGFTFKRLGLIWDKGQMGMGHWTRTEGEIALLFTRGRPQRTGKGVRQIIRERRREHSRKPDDQYARIEALVGGPYLELFARTARPGWRSWGLETGRFNAPQEERAA